MDRTLFARTRCLSRALLTPRASTSTRAPCPFVARPIHTSRPLAMQSRPPKSHDRGPKSEEDTQTDFNALDVLRNTAPPATSIDTCDLDGFAMNNGTRASGCGLLLVGGEAFKWRPWVREGRASGEDVEVMRGRLRNAKGQWEVDEDAWGVLELVWPKPDLLIIGTGPQIVPIAPAVRKYLNGLGIRLEIQDTRNAAAQFNLLATERGVGQVAAAMIPIGWQETK